MVRKEKSVQIHDFLTHFYEIKNKFFLKKLIRISIML